MKAQRRAARVLHAAGAGQTRLSQRYQRRARLARIIAELRADAADAEAKQRKRGLARSDKPTGQPEQPQ